MIDRRQLLRGALWVAAAPLIVRSSSIMKVVAPAQGWPYYGGLATLTSEFDYETTNMITRWRYGDRLGIGLVTPRHLMRDLGSFSAPGFQMRQLERAAGNALRVKHA